MKRRRLFFLLGISLSVLLAICFLQKPLLLWGARRLVSSTFPHAQSRSLSYEKAEMHGRTLLLTGVSLKQGDKTLKLDQLHLKAGFDFKKWAFQPRVFALHPDLQLGQSGDFDFTFLIRALAPSRFFRLKMDVQHGVMQLGGERFYFTFASGGAKEGEAVLRLALDPKLLGYAPFLTVHFEMRGNELLASLKMKEVQADQLLKVLSMMGQRWAATWQGVRGIIDLEGHAIISSSGAIRESSARFSLKTVEFLHSGKSLVFQADSLKGHLKLDPQGASLWEDLSASISVDQAHLKWKEELQLALTSGHLSFDPGMEPSVDIEGMVGAFDFSFHGKGALHQDETYWLECLLRGGRGQERDCELLFSLCSPQLDQLVMEIEAKACDAKLLSALQTLLPQPLEMLEGTFSGKMLLCFCRGGIQRLEFEQVIGKQPLFSWQGKQLHAEEFCLTGDAKKLLNLTLRLSDKEKVSAQIKPKKGKNEVTALFEGPGKTRIQFGWTAERLFPEKTSDFADGWIRCAELTPAFYAPLLEKWLPSLHLQTTFDLFGTWSGQELELSFQCDQLEGTFLSSQFIAPKIGERDGFLLRTKGRAKLYYLPQEKELDLDIPFAKATFIDEELGLKLASAEGRLSYGSVSGLALEIEKAALFLEEIEILDQLQATLTAESPSCFQIKEFKGKAGQTSVTCSELSFEKGRSFLNELHLKGPLGEFKGSGDLLVDLPTKELPLCLRASLRFAGKLGGSTVQTKEPVKVAFAPALGLVASRLCLQLPQGHEMTIDQLEFLPTQESFFARGCHLGTFPHLGLGQLGKEGFVFKLSDQESELTIQGKWTETLQVLVKAIEEQAMAIAKTSEE